MKLTFEEFWKKLIEHEIWYDQMKMRFYRKDLKGVANNCFIFLIASEQRWALQDYQDFRKCYQSFLMKSPDQLVKPQLQQVEVAETKQNEPIVTGPERDEWLRKWKEAINEAPIAKPVPKLTRKQIIEEGDWIPKKSIQHPSTSILDLKRAFIHQLYIKHNYDPKARTVEKLTNWIPEQDWINENEFELNELWQEELTKKVTN